MSYSYKNENPYNKEVDDCVIRAIATATGKSWDEVFLELEVYAFAAKDLPNANRVWSQYLTDNGFIRRILPDTCPICYTVRDFVHDNREGVFIVGDGTHVVAVVDGFYVDTFDSGDRTVLFSFERTGG